MFVYRDYRWRDFPPPVYPAPRTLAMVMMLIARSAGRRDLVCRLRRRPGPDGGRYAADLAVLRRHVPGADGGHLHPRNIAVVAARPLSLSVGALTVAALSVAAAHIEKLTLSVISKRGGRTAA